MNRSVRVELDLPKDWRRFKMPPALNNRLQFLLDRLDENGNLSKEEQKEAHALVELGEMLTLMKLRATKGRRRKYHEAPWNSRRN